MVSRLAQRVTNAATTELAPGEQIQATLRYATFGVSPWLLYSFGAIGAMLASSRMRTYALVATDRRLLVLRQGGMVKGNWALEGSCPLSAARVATFKPGVLFGKIVLELPGDSGASGRTLPLNFSWTLRTDARLVAAALTRPGA